MAIEFELPEGATPIDPEEAKGLIPNLGTQGELNEFEAANILAGTIWAQRSRTIKKALLDQSSLRMLHKQMLGDTWKWAGVYRTTQKNIGCEAWQISTQMKALQDDVEVWIANGTYPADEIAARFHHRLVSIHPFPNGNGRFSRLATDLLCGQNGWPISNWGATDLGKQSKTRRAYIEALQDADRHDYSSLITFMRT